MDYQRRGYVWLRSFVQNGKPLRSIDWAIFKLVELFAYAVLKAEGGKSSVPKYIKTEFR